MAHDVPALNVPAGLGQSRSRLLHLTHRYDRGTGSQSVDRLEHRDHEIMQIGVRDTTNVAIVILG